MNHLSQWLQDPGAITLMTPPDLMESLRWSNYPSPLGLDSAQPQEESSRKDHVELWVSAI